MSLVFDVWFLAAITCVLVLFYRPRTLRPKDESTNSERTFIESEIDTLAGLKTEIAFPDKNPVVARGFRGIRREIVCNVT